MPTFEIVSIIALILLAWLWFDSTHVRAIGIQAARNACKSENIQLLDDTVSFVSLTLERNDNGQLAFRRTYAFDYSDTGNNRRRGSIVMRGQRVLVINIGLRLASPITLH